jgi:hypothetical protein
MSKSKKSVVAKRLSSSVARMSSVGEMSCSVLRFAMYWETFGALRPLKLDIIPGPCVAAASSLRLSSPRTVAGVDVLLVRFEQAFLCCEARVKGNRVSQWVAGE